MQQHNEKDQTDWRTLQHGVHFYSGLVIYNHGTQRPLQFCFQNSNSSFANHAVVLIGSTDHISIFCLEKLDFEHKNLSALLANPPPFSPRPPLLNSPRISHIMRTSCPLSRFV